MVLGGCGVVGSIAIKTLASFSDFSKVIIGDLNEEKAHEIINEMPKNKVLYRKIDVMDTNELRKTIKNFDVVVNCIGPFYEFGPIVLNAAIEAGIKYVDVNDDIDATQKVLEFDQKAKKQEVTAVIGLGSSPGVTNLLAKFASEQLLDEVETIDLYHAHGGEPEEGPGVIYHRIHAMTIDIPVFIDGEFKTVSFFDERGQALEETIDFQKIGKYRVHPYPHPETITIPRYITGVKRVTNKGTVLPPEYFYLITDLVKLGLGDEAPVKIRDIEIRPIDFAIAYIIRERKRILKEKQFGQQKGCVKIVVGGTKDGKKHTIVFSLASEGEAMGEGTGIPVALGAIMLQRGLIQEKGVLPPEACVDPLGFLGIMQEYLNLESATAKSSPLTIESIDHTGKIDRIEL
ncbi:MAG: saccharopine dehydrogenase family protein [Candidatus Hodarchaeales archaeon]